MAEKPSLKGSGSGKKNLIGSIRHFDLFLTALLALISNRPLHIWHVSFFDVFHEMVDFDK